MPPETPQTQPADAIAAGGRQRATDATPAAVAASTAWSHHVRTLRVACGLVMFTYVLLHLSNHALGNFSVELMQESQVWMVGLFRRLPGTILLGGAALIHFSLALWADLRRLKAVLERS